MRCRAAIICVGGAFALLTLAWAMSTGSFSAPDEAAHYLRALTIANWDLLGPKVIAADNGVLNPTQLAYARASMRGVITPARMSPPNETCANGRPDRGSGGCMEVTYTGVYFPLPYLAPSVAIGASDDVSTASWTARLASALVAVMFIVTALALLWSGSGWSLLGPLIAITPMVLFVSSVINPNGFEIGANLAFAAAVLRIARAPAGQPRWVWAAAAGSGAAALLGWQAGPGFVATDIVMLAGLLGLRGFRRMYAAQRARMAVTGGVLLASLGAFVVWNQVAGTIHTGFNIHPFLKSLQGGFAQLGPVLHQAIGTFGLLSVNLPAWAYWIWWLLVLGLVVVAYSVGTRRERTTLALIVLLVVLFPVLSYAWAQRLTGFGLQGRYVLPELILIPLLAGEIVRRRVDRQSAGPMAVWLARATFAAVGLFQGFAWWSNARVTAGAPDTILFSAHATWAPPLGWIPWLVAAAIATFGLITYAGWAFPIRGADRLDSRQLRMS